jgi:hypothetical protein
MELHPLPGALRPDLERLATEGEVRRLHRGPQTVQQVLDGAREAMAEEDRLEEMARDPIAYARAQRARRTLWGRLMHGRAS